MFKFLLTILVIFSSTSFASNLCFTEQPLSFGQRAKCVQPLHKKICDQSRILQSCEKNMNMIAAIYNFVEQRDNRDMQDEINLAEMHLDFLDFAKVHYPLLYNIIAYNSHH